MKGGTIIKKIIYLLVAISLPLFLTCDNPSDMGAEQEKTASGKDRQETVSSQGAEKPQQPPLIIEVDKNEDPGLVLLENERAEEHVYNFYRALTGNEEITREIITNAQQYNVPLPLVFSLVWVESRFSPVAYSKNYSSIDRGLFQLNSNSFPHLSRDEFYNIETNTQHGVKYIRWCLDKGGNTIAALAMYNAGKTRVEQGGTPRSTLDYISKILEYRERIEEDFIIFMKHMDIIVERGRSGNAIVLK